MYLYIFIDIYSSVSLDSPFNLCIASYHSFGYLSSRLSILDFILLNSLDGERCNQQVNYDPKKYFVNCSLNVCLWVFSGKKETGTIQYLTMVLLISKFISLL